MKIESVNLGKLKESETPNPNRLDSEKFALLVRAMKAYGCLQPLLVRPNGGGKYTIVDGHHRARAAREAGLKAVDCVVLKTNDDVAAIQSLGLNRLRGEMDLGVVGDMLKTLHENDFSIEELELTGFTQDEIQTLLDQAGEVDLSDAMAVSPPSMDPEEKQAKHRLRLEFESKADLDLVVLAALEHGATVEKGLVAWARSKLKQGGD